MHGAAEVKLTLAWNIYLRQVILIYQYAEKSDFLKVTSAP